MSDNLEFLQKKFIEAYNPETFREQGHKMIDLLAEHLKNVENTSINEIFSNKTPDEIKKACQNNFEGKFNGSFINIEKELMGEITSLHSPHFLGHQVSSPLPLSVLSDMLMSMTNNSSCVFEMGRSAAGSEKAVVEWMCKKIGYDENSDGVLTSGGSLGNLTALLAARQAKMGYDIWNEGIACNKPTILVSSQAHYSVKRAAAIMGLGSNGAIAIESNSDCSMNIENLKSAYEKSKKEGRQVFAVVANACSTSTGTYDDLECIAKFCNENDLWLHVDGAHGASALLSNKHKNLLKGIEKADSVIWDAHKMMMLPALVTGVLFKDESSSRHTFSQKASYLLDSIDGENWYDYGYRTMECTKPAMSFKVYSALKYYGEQFFGDYIDYVYGLTKEFANFLKSTDDFEIAVEPQSNIICFRYVSKADTDLNQLQLKIREKLLVQQKFYIVKTNVSDKTYLRCTIINPLTNMQHLKQLMEEIRKIARVV